MESVPSVMPTVARPKVLIGVSGSVATIKIGLLSAAVREFADVRVIATEPARHFISTLEPSVQAALGEVAGDDTEWHEWAAVGDPVLHIELRRWADVFVIAPLSANTLAKLANGLCNNLLTCVVRAWDFKKPLLVAPAMNTHMWESPFTERHLAVLRALGAEVIPPVAKTLACGDIGNGAMAHFEDIASAVRRAAAPAAPPPAPSLQHLPAGDYIPIVDLSPLVDGSRGGAASLEEAKTAMAAAVRTACLTSGFFYVKNHGVHQDLLDGQLAAARQLFDLPSAEKAAMAAALSPLHRGFNSLETGQHNCTAGDGRDRKESFTLGASGGASPMHGDNVWPKGGPRGLNDAEQWRTQNENFLQALLQLARQVARALALSLSLEEGFFADRMRDPPAQCVLLKYPPAAANQSTGCGAHTDCGFLTILLNDEVSGLEVKWKDTETWVAANKVEGCLLVNLGDLMAHWSNDMYRSTWHRVLSPASETRYSVPYFCNCDFDAEVECITTLTPGREAKYGKVTAGRYIMDKLGLMFE